MVEIKIWHDIYKSLPDDGERVIIDYFGIESEAIWRRSISSWEIQSAEVEERIYRPRINPFTSGNCRYWRREIFSSFNGNIKEGDMCMNKKTMSFLRQVVMTVLGIALGGVIFGLPGALVVGLVMVIKKWPK